MQTAQLHKARGYLGRGAVYHFARLAACAQIRCYLKRCGKRIVCAVSHEERRVRQTVVRSLYLAFHTARGNEQGAEILVGQRTCLVGREDIDLVEVLFEFVHECFMRAAHHV